MSAVEPGDVLFRWVNTNPGLLWWLKRGIFNTAFWGDWKHRQIIIQQGRASETLMREENLIGNKVFADFTDKHIVHVAIAGENDDFWEVGLGGLKKQKVEEREHYDLIVRFTGKGVKTGICKILGLMRPIDSIGPVIKYPTRKVGINVLGAAGLPVSPSKSAPLVRRPAVPLPHRELKERADYPGGHMNEEDAYLFAYLSTTGQSASLKEYNALIKMKFEKEQPQKEAWTRGLYLSSSAHTSSTRCCITSFSKEPDSSRPSETIFAMAWARHKWPGSANTAMVFGERLAGSATYSTRAKSTRR